MPARSPFTSAIKTGIPRALKFSASVCNVTVFPVPVAPAIKPCRFAIFGSKKIRSFDSATRIGSTMVLKYDFANGAAIVQRSPASCNGHRSHSLAKRHGSWLHDSIEDQRTLIIRRSVKIRFGERERVSD